MIESIGRIRLMIGCQARKVFQCASARNFVAVVNQTFNWVGGSMVDRRGKRRSPEEGQFFGEVAFELGYVTTAELYEGLTAQARLEVEGKPHRFLGEILVELGYLTERPVLEVLSAMHQDERSRVRDRWA